MKVVNPWNDKVVGEVKDFTKEEVEKVFRNAKEFDKYFSHTQRAEWLEKTAEILGNEKDKIAELITSESGLCISSTLHEVDRSIETLLESAKICKERIRLDTYLDPLSFSNRENKDAFATEPMNINGKTYTVLYEPIGIVSSVTPFNHPLHQVVSDVSSSIAAGNNAVVKPSSKTPLSALKLREILDDVGVPKYTVQIVTGKGSEIGNYMVENDYADMVSFTGGTETGKKVAEKSGLKKNLLELGGNGSLVVCDDANLEQSVDVAVKGAFGNSGQRCTAVKRIFVFPSIADKFVEEFKKKTSELNYGNPMDISNYLGTVIDEESAKNIERKVQNAINDGAELILGHKRNKALYSPTILDKVNPESELVKDETFGPVGPIIRVNNLDETIDLINSTGYGLQAGIMTNNINNFSEYVGKIKTGAVVMNDGPHCSRPSEVPFGGRGKTGYGRKGPLYGMLEMSNIKWVGL